MFAFCACVCVCLSVHVLKMMELREEVRNDEDGPAMCYPISMCVVVDLASRQRIRSGREEYTMEPACIADR